jgi:hypothetical protein
LHASVSLTKALAEPSLLLASIARQSPQHPAADAIANRRRPSGQGVAGFVFKSLERSSVFNMLERFCG